MGGKLRANRGSKRVGKSPSKEKYPLRGKPVIYREPFRPADSDESQNPARVPGVDKGKVIIKLDFDEPLPEFEECRVPSPGPYPQFRRYESHSWRDPDSPG